MNIFQSDLLQVKLVKIELDRSRWAYLHRLGVQKVDYFVLAIKRLILVVVAVVFGRQWDQFIDDELVDKVQEIGEVL